MRNRFTLFQSHLDLAHQYWSRLITVGDRVIDATCGNGHDTVFLASLGAKVISIDVQQEAINQAIERAQNEGVDQFVTFVNGCHSEFPEEVENSSVKLIVYNLGYLPGGDKEITTQVMTTQTSIQHAMELISPGGMISITCYPGHQEGQREEEELLNFFQILNPQDWSCCQHRWVNRKQSPSLILLQKNLNFVA
ncbi:MAG: class I SAM-dependent methyltransferase [Chlamydiota bacterium]